MIQNKQYKFQSKDGKTYICKFNHVIIAKEFAKLSNIKFIGEVKC